MLQFQKAQEHSTQWNYIKGSRKFFARLMSNEKVCYFEMVEINPTLDKENLMAEHAFEILLRATNFLIND